MPHTYPLLPLLLLVAGTASAGELPARRPGLWETTVSIASMAGSAPAMRMCIDAATDDLLSRDESRGQRCQRVEVRREGERYRIRAVCRLAATTSTTEGFFEGDFSRRYHGELQTHYAPAQRGVAPTKVLLDGRWLGPCPADLRPGDMLLPDGRRVPLRP